jgi:hypothetical protein
MHSTMYKNINNFEIIPKTANVKTANVIYAPTLNM